MRRPGVGEQAALGQAGHLDAHHAPLLHHRGDRGLGEDARDLLAEPALDLDPVHLAGGGLGVLGRRAGRERRAGRGGRGAGQGGRRRRRRQRAARTRSPPNSSATAVRAHRHEPAAEGALAHRHDARPPPGGEDGARPLGRAPHDDAGHGEVPGARTGPRPRDGRAAGREARRRGAGGGGARRACREATLAEPGTAVNGRAAVLDSALACGRCSSRDPARRPSGRLARARAFFAATWPGRVVAAAFGLWLLDGLALARRLGPARPDRRAGAGRPLALRRLARLAGLPLGLEPPPLAHPDEAHRLVPLHRPRPRRPADPLHGAWPSSSSSASPPRGS